MVAFVLAVVWGGGRGFLVGAIEETVGTGEGGGVEFSGTGVDELSLGVGVSAG